MNNSRKKDIDRNINEKVPHEEPPKQEPVIKEPPKDKLKQKLPPKEDSERKRRPPPKRKP
jgi:hypothetical protein